MVTRSVLAEKLYGIAHGFNLKAVLKAIISQILQRNIPHILYIDLKSFYNWLVKLSTSFEKRLMIYIISFCQS